MTPYKQYLNRMEALDLKITLWSLKNKITQDEMAKKLKISQPLFSFHKKKYTLKKFEGKILSWPTDVMLGLIRMTKGTEGAIVPSDFNSFDPE